MLLEEVVLGFLQQLGLRGLGAKVAIIEKMNSFGGVATLGLVNVWHSLYNTEFNKQIIAGNDFRDY